MAKFLTIFNLIAGAASIAGLLLLPDASLSSRYVLVPFVVALAVSAYVLLVPDTTLERNVRSKTQVELFEPPSSSDGIAIQQGQVTIKTNGSKVAVKFERPFASPPVVELINTGGATLFTPTVDTVTAHQAIFDPHLNMSPVEKGEFTSVARGVLLRRKASDQ